jgi:RNA polymerase sigma factor (sigma-70 family)
MTPMQELTRRCAGGVLEQREAEGGRSVITAVDPGADDDGLSAFFRVRPRLFGIAYRMLGSVAEAEDTVQDVWVRWQTTDRSVVRDAPAFLAKTTTRLAINVVRSARSRRETPAGRWVREPVDTSADAGSGAERGEALRTALLVLQESLPPTERAVYVLREAFDYPYREIADILGLEEANARQLATRARQRIADGRRALVSSCDQGRLIDAFMAASQRGDLAALEVRLASDIASRTDRGRLARTARIPAVDGERVAHGHRSEAG